MAITIQLQGAKTKFLIGIFLLGFIYIQEAKAHDFDYIKPFKISREINRNTPAHILKVIILHYMNMKIDDEQSKLKVDDIEYVQYVGCYRLAGLDSDSVLVFRWKLDYRLPDTTGNYHRVFIVDNSRHNAYLLMLNSVEPIRVHTDDDLYYFAGRYKDRYQYGVFKIYRFNQDILAQIFQSDEYVSNYSLDCVSYEDDDLILDNTDINGDGLLDLRFTGVKNYYCNGFENYSRIEKAPIRSEPISITYLFDPTTFNWEK